MDTTTNIRLPYIIAAQAQKHVTHNEALRALDVVVQLAITDRDLASPPATPADGARYIISAGATAAWAGQSGNVAAWQDGAWAFHTPAHGWVAWIIDESKAIVFDGAAWVDLIDADALLNPASFVGVNATADGTNRLSVKTDAVLFSHDDVTPGTGNMRQVLNKATTSATVSQLYQSAWSGRAETGLTGDDNFHVKVSPDGSAWHEAMVIDRSSGEVRLPATPAPAPAASALAPAKIKIESGASDVTILTIGDSTGDEPDEWIYRFATGLATQYPTHSVLYYLWNDTSGAYAAPATLSTGSGSRTIRFYNASVGGFHITRWMTTRYANAIGALTPDLIITNDGLNLYTSTVVDIRRRYIAALQRILLDKPGTPIAVVLQLALQSSNGMDTVIEALHQVAHHMPAVTLIDAHARFVEAGKPASWYANDSHPTPTGSGVTLAEVQRHWRAARNRLPRDVDDSWLEDRASINLIPNGDFAAWTRLLPDHWGTSSATGVVAKDTVNVYPGKPHSLRLEGANKFVVYRIEGEALRPLRGKRLTLAVRVRGTVGGNATVGKSYVAIDANISGKLAVDIGTTEGNGWQWQIIDDLRVPQTVASIDVYLASNGTGAATDIAYFDEVVLYAGEAAPERTATRLTEADHTAPIFNLLKDAGRFGGSPEPQSSGVTTFTNPTYVTAANGATIVAGPKFIFDNSDYGGAAAALNGDVKALIEKTKDTAVNAAYGRYGIEFYLLDITAGSGTSTARTIDAVTHYLPFTLRSVPIPFRLSFNCHVLVKSGSVGATLADQNRLYVDGRRVRKDQTIVPSDDWRQLTRLYDIDPRRTTGYDNIFHNIYATPGTRFYLAVPALVPGHIPISPDYFYGVVPSLEAWR